MFTQYPLMHPIHTLGLTFWVFQWFPVFAAVVHAEHKRIQNERHNDGHHHLEKAQAKYHTGTVTFTCKDKGKTQCILTRH